MVHVTHSILNHPFTICKKRCGNSLKFRVEVGKWKFVKLLMCVHLLHFCNVTRDSRSYSTINNIISACFNLFQIFSYMRDYD